MVRRVGFGDGEETPPAPPDPPSPSAGPRRRPLDIRFQRPVPRQLLKGQNPPVVWFVMAFLAFWLVGWTIVIVFVVREALAQPGADPFVFVWLAFAIIAWAFAIWVLANILRGLFSRPEKPD